MSPPLVNKEWLKSSPEKVKDVKWISEYQNKCVLIYSDDCSPHFIKLEDAVKAGFVYKLEYITKLGEVDLLRDQHGQMFVIKVMKVFEEEKEMQTVIYNKMDERFAVRLVYYGHVRRHTNPIKKPDETFISFALIQPFIIDQQPKNIPEYPELEKTLWYLNSEFNHVYDLDSKSSNYIFTKKGVRCIDYELTVYSDAPKQKHEDGRINYDYRGKVTNDGVLVGISFETFSSEIAICLATAILRPDIIDMPPNRQLPILKLISGINILTPESLHITEKKILMLFGHAPELKNMLTRNMGLPIGGNFTMMAVCMISLALSVLPNIITSMFTEEYMKAAFYSDASFDDIRNHLETHNAIMHAFFGMLMRVKEPCFGLIKQFKDLMMDMHKKNRAVL